jgi:dCMP deaminase
MNEKKLFSDIVLRFSRESHCILYKVAAIAVKNGRIVATGINGTHPGLQNCDHYFRDYFFSLPQAANVIFEDWTKTEEAKKLHHEWADINEVHAEVSLCGEAIKNGTALADTDIYVTHRPCMHCSKLLATFKPKNVFYIFEYDKAPLKSIEILQNCDINIEKI